jgi:hypothetical protein
MSMEARGSQRAWARAAFCLLLFGWLPLTAAAQAPAPPPFAIVYEARSGGSQIGVTESRLTALGGGRYEYRNDTAAAGLLSLLSSEHITETSRFDWHDGRARPEHYSRLRSSGKGRPVEQRFDWARGEVLARHGGEEKRYAAAPGLQDRMSVLLSVTAALAAQQPPGTHAVAGDNEAQRHRFEDQGNDKLATPLGELLTRRVVRYKDGAGTPSLRLWLAPALGWLPVRLEKDDDGKAILLEAVSISR